MTIRSMIAKAGTRCTIKYPDDSIEAGAQNKTEWRLRYANIPCRINALKTRQEILYYDQQKVFADFLFYIEYLQDITTSDRIYFKDREFEIKKIDNWDETNLYLRIAALEIRNT